MLRWENYFMKSNGHFETFWKTYQANSKPDILYIMGMGFDPRTNLGIESIYSVNVSERRDTILLRYYRTAEEKSVAPTQAVQEHIDRLNSFLQAKGYSAPQIKDVVL